ncbi:MAG: hypothetical protein K9G33_03230 [Sneathiella sp.]|nr:hypothetical protein [Sneathiella sp.]
MSIDWVTIAAQLVNFLILVWLLKRFLYRPILDGIDARETEISQRVAEAKAATEKARLEERAYRSELEKLNAQKTQFLEAARTQATDEREKLKAETQKLINAERANGQAEMTKMKEDYAADLKAAGAGAILSLTRKVLKDLSDAELEERIVAQLEGRLPGLGQELQASSGASEKAVVLTSFALPEKTRARFTKSFHKLVADVPLNFETDKTQSPGVVLQLGGARIGWTIESYLDGLEGMLEKRLGMQAPHRNGGS